MLEAAAGVASGIIAGVCDRFDRYCSRETRIWRVPMRHAAADTRLIRGSEGSFHAHFMLGGKCAAGDDGGGGVRGGVVASLM